MNTFCKGVHQLFTLFTLYCSKIKRQGEQVNTWVNSFTKLFTP
ncbi:hypothetical protein ECSTEC94C_3364 [Escherichia coli STEC_94C]|nr:hypothetical protein ECSTEC94C_3364 [Escherichia coli STEC_94C]